MGDNVLNIVLTIELNKIFKIKIMKSIVFKSLFLLGFFALLASCKNEKTVEPTEQKATSITLKVDKQAVELGETIKFNVVSNLGKDVSTQSKITVNGQEISGLTYKTSMAGTVRAYAMYNSLKSSEVSVTVNEPANTNQIVSVVVESNGKSLTGEVLELTAKATMKDGSVVDKTSTAQFMIDGNVISGNQWLIDKKGEIQITAKIDNVTSNMKKMMTKTPDLLDEFTKKSVLEHFTGTWCGNCPRVSYKYDQVKAKNENIYIVGIHQNDAYSNDASKEVSKHFSTTSTAKGFLNRDVLQWDEDVSQTLNDLKGTKMYGLSVGSVINTENKVDIVINTGFRSKVDGAKLLVYLVENVKIPSQSNYTSYYGGESTIKNYAGHPIRHILTDVNGKSISGEIGVGVSTFTVDASKYANKLENVSILAMLIEGSDIINAQQVKIGTFQKFD